MYKILVVDDDKNIVRIISDMLKNEYEVTASFDGEEAVQKALQLKPDLIIMDVMMPRMSGIEATVRIREASNAPILMLSAKAEGSDRVLGLSSGADDYLVKPFYREELTARVRALLRRYDTLGSIREAEGQEVFTCGDILLNAEEKKLYVRSDPVRLTPTEYKIMDFLMRNQAHVFSAEEIYAHVWEGESFSVENTVMVHISRLRNKIELNPRKPEHLKVIWGIGYVLE